MQSSIEQLKDAVGKLTWVGDNELSGAIACAKNIAESFIVRNKSLQGGWETVADFCMKINNASKECLEETYEMMREFCENTYSNEAQALNATQQANDKAAEILKELGIN